MKTSARLITEIDRKILDALTQIQAAQSGNGSFLSFSSSDQSIFKKTKKYTTTFHTSLILSCTKDIENNKTRESISKKAIKFLKSEKSQSWTYNYWSRKSKEFTSMPYPDDLDDTFCALIAINYFEPKLLDGSALAKIISVLTQLEKKEGGPYKTWVVSSEKNSPWSDIDLAANSNIAYFLENLGVQLPRINKLVEKAIKNKEYKSPYYPSEFPVIYYVSRFYQGSHKNLIIDHLLNSMKNSGNWGSQINTALATSSLIRLGYPAEKLKKAIQFLLKNSKYLPEPFCLDPAINGKPYFSGSASLTAAFCIETLGLYKKNFQKKPDNKSSYNKIETAVRKKAASQFESFSPDIRFASIKIFEKILGADKKTKITLLPTLFKESLKEKSIQKIDDNDLINLGLANLYGWIAYTIYDDFLDEEGDPRVLSTANCCLRYLTKIFLDIVPNNIDFWKIAEKTLDQIDAANAWEVSNCRAKINGNRVILPSKLPDFREFSPEVKSFGHALGPIAILFKIGFANSSPEINKTILFFKHYLIAKQLNDDAHDWLEDLKKGHLTFVNCLVLKALKIKKVDLSQENIFKLNEIFWHKTINDVAQTINNNIKEAEKNLLELSITEDKALLSSLLEPLKRSAQKAIAERDDTLKFLKHFSIKK